MAVDKPTLLALLFCDSIIVDETSKKKTLVGVFTHINTPGFPCVHASMSVYISLRNAEGDHELTMKLIHMETDALIGEVQIKVNFIDKTKPSDLGLNLPPTNLPESGRYEFQLWDNGDLLGTQEFVALLQEERL